ncbi:ABC transporter permease [Microvirga sp. W0021]|uniref:ABC transporter permease n=1 Tax=Hohaiivirga grylli TaxID=3133970 RepID=A0ABV0BIC2_9HYPH
MKTASFRLLRRSETAIALILILAMLVIGFINPAFWQLDNLFSLLRSNIILGIMALGVLLVMISGGIDVSFPAFAVAGMYLTIKSMSDPNFIIYIGDVPVFVAFALSAGIGLICGAANAFVIHTFKAIPLIVTLGMASVVRGLLLGIVGTSIVNIGEMPKSLMNFASANMLTLTKADGTTSSLTAMVLIYALLAVVIHCVLKYTMMGRSVYALGGDGEAAKRVGFNTRRTTYFIYCTAGALAGFAGLLYAAMNWQADPRVFGGYDMQVIAAVVLGGASIFGGYGSVLGTVLGVFMFVMVQNSLIIMGIPTTWQRVVIGVIVLLAAAISAWRDYKSRAGIGRLS